jgi:hypothetical protein
VKIRVTTSRPTVDYLTQKSLEGKLRIRPVEDSSLQELSKYVEMLFARVPLPEVVLDTRENVWDVMLGEVQLYAIDAYVRNCYQLTGLKVFTDLEGTRFENLSPRFQRMIEEHRVRTVSVEPGTSFDMMKAVKYWLE